MSLQRTCFIYTAGRRRGSSVVYLFLSSGARRRQASLRQEFHIWGKSRLFTLNTEVMDGEFVLKYVQCSKPVFFVGCLWWCCEVLWGESQDNPPLGLFPSVCPVCEGLQGKQEHPSLLSFSTRCGTGVALGSQENSLGLPLALMQCEPSLTAWQQQPQAAQRVVLGLFSGLKVNTAVWDTGGILRNWMSEQLQLTPLALNRCLLELGEDGLCDLGMSLPAQFFQTVLGGSWIATPNLASLESPLVASDGVTHL